MANETVMSEMEKIVQRNALKFQVGQSMFCPGCNTIMDCTRAVGIDVMKDGKLTASRVLCAICWDAKKDAFLPQVATHGCTVEVHDGRELFGRPAKRAKSKPPKAAPKLDMDRIMEMAEAGDGEGMCTACGAEVSEVEPDARKRKCDSCGEMKVYGAEELLIMYA